MSRGDVRPAGRRPALQPANGHAFAVHAPEHNSAGPRRLSALAAGRIVGTSIGAARGAQVRRGAAVFGSGTVNHASAPPGAAAAIRASPPCDLAIVSTIARPSPLPPPPRA